MKMIHLAVASLLLVATAMTAQEVTFLPQNPPGRARC